MYKPQSLDTSEKIDRLQFARYREMSVEEKAQIVSELNEMVQRLAFAGMRERYPDATDDEIWLRLASLRLGRETVRKVYGWDPGDE
jgi:hypothetical protein